MSSQCYVVKRNNSRELFDVTKIRKVLEFVAEGLDVNLLELESNIHIVIKDGITSKKINDSLIVSALNLTSLEEPDWKYIAGKLKLLDLHKDVEALRGFKITNKNIQENYCKFVSDAVNAGIYDKTIIKKYTLEELEQASKFINLDNDFVYDYAGINLLIKRYLCEHNDKVFELPQEMFLTIALLVEQNEKKELRLERVKDTYEKISNRKISLATPLLMNLRRKNGNLSSCFITAIDDSRESIFYTIDQISSISKYGGGVGVNISRIRSKGSRIKNIKNASGGVIPWIRIINDTAVAVNQQGKRKGAVTVALDVWHLDILDFLDLQTENGDQRMKAYDIFPQIVVPDIFMQAVENNDEWLLCDPYEVKLKYDVNIGDLWGEEFESFYNKLVHDAKNGKIELFKFLNAKEILKSAMKSQIETGMPYIAFKDTLNRYNPNKHDGLILSTNLCTESHSNVKPSIISKKILNDDNTTTTNTKDGLVHVCNLVSVNLANVSEEELEDVCKTSVRILDNAIDFTEVPILEGVVHNQRYRTIGVGAMGLADWLAFRDTPYSKSMEAVSELFEKFSLFCIKASIDISKNKGVFKAYKGSDWDKGVILGHKQEWFEQNSLHFEEWREVFDNLQKYGIRNSQITAIAPNTSSSLIQGCTASILPVYSKFFVETHGKGSIPNCPPFIKDKFWFYQENKVLDQKIIVDVVSNISKWIDTGVSMELVYNLNLGVSAKDIYTTILKAWKKEIKTIYYTRSIQKDGSMNNMEDCISCTN